MENDCGQVSFENLAAPLLQKFRFLMRQSLTMNTQISYHVFVEKICLSLGRLLILE